MNTLLRRLRAAIAIGLAWALAWFSAGMVLLLVVGLGAADVPFPLFFGLLGFVAGVTFSGILGAVEGRRSFEEMSMGRFALWGGAGGLVLTLVMALVTGAGSIPLVGSIFVLAGAGCAAGSLALARRAEGPEALEAGSDDEPGQLGDDRVGRVAGASGGVADASGRVADVSGLEVGLTAEEKRALFGE